MKSIAVVWPFSGRHHAPHQHISSLGEALEKVLLRVLIVVALTVVAAFVFAPGTLKEKAARFAFYHELKHEFALKPIALFEPKPLPLVLRPAAGQEEPLVVKLPTQRKDVGAQAYSVNRVKPALKKKQAVVKKPAKPAMASTAHAGSLGTLTFRVPSHGPQVVHRGFGVFQGRVPVQ